jgi:small subunit ribosomal protein S21|tara:strand:- start:912 stop:1163 length:252 start_codon:yes stop_codon:yes gene_type:complete
MSRDYKREPDKGLKVTVVNNDVGRALRKLKKKIANDGLLQELRERQHYEKPSTKRKKAKAAAKKRWQKKAAEMELPSKSDRKY